MAGRTEEFAAGVQQPTTVPAPGSKNGEDDGHSMSSDLFEAMEHAQSGE